MENSTDFAWSYFLKEKSESKTMMMSSILDLKAMYGNYEKYARCDNTGENECFKLGLQTGSNECSFEYTMPDIPQQNGRVKRKFTILFNRVQAMLNGGKFSSILRDSLWAETANMATLFENNIFSPTRDLSPFQQIFRNRKRSILPSVQKFSKICIITHCGSSQQVKLVNQGTPGIWVGFVDGHPVDTNGILNPKI